MQHVTFDTAKRLKEAGFPQMEPEFGQVWYDTNEMPCLIFEGDSMKNVWTACPGRDYGQRVHVGTLKRNYTFAPTATDILRELPESFYLHKHILNGSLFWGCTNGRFAMPEDPFLDSGWHPTATQATSEVFFAIQRQPT